MRWVTIISRARAAALAILIVAALVAACGSDDDNGGGSTTAANTGTAAAKPSTSSAGGAGAKSVSDYQAYVGGKAGKADSSKSPVYIGWVNQQGGQQEI